MSSSSVLDQTTFATEVEEELPGNFASSNTRNYNQNQNHSHDHPMNIATINSGFEKGDFLVREEKGQRVYFDFFEEAFNYLAHKGYARMKDDEGSEWMEAVNAAHESIPNGTRYNTGTCLMVLSKPVDLTLLLRDRSYSGNGSGHGNVHSVVEKNGNGDVEENDGGLV